MMEPKNLRDAALRRLGPWFEASGRRRGRSSAAAHVYMPNELSNAYLSLQVPADGPISGHFLLPAERQHAHVVVPHRRCRPQLPTASPPDGPEHACASCSAQNPPWHALARHSSRSAFYRARDRSSDALSTVLKSAARASARLPSGWRDSWDVGTSRAATEAGSGAGGVAIDRALHVCGMYCE